MPEIGNLSIRCATCNEPLEIPIEASIEFQDGAPFIDTKADVSGLWLHAWSTHEGEMGS